tara:strand:+ start:228 stop:446 length:219 start_codon:yes stop_codon:yes gene_type:complete
MIEQETLFDMSPDENKEMIENSEIEWLILYFKDNKKKKLTLNIEKLLSVYDLDNHSDLVYKLVEEKIEKISS